MTASDVKIEKPTEEGKQVISLCRVVAAAEIVTIEKPSIICTIDGNILEKLKPCSIDIKYPEFKKE